MESNLAKFKKELERLIAEGQGLRIRMASDLNLFDERRRKQLEDLDIPSFTENYERWYSLAMQVVKQLLPDRFADFVRQYNFFSAHREIVFSEFHLRRSAVGGDGSVARSV